MLEVESIEKHFDTGAERVSVLTGASLTLDSGHSIVIMGPSGSGKSTLLNIIGTLEPPSAGRVTLDGIDPFALGASELARFRNTRIGFVFQEHHLLPQCTVLENVLLPTLPLASRHAADRAEGLLERVGLTHRLRHRPGELSGGERQRVAIARALVNAPAVVLADEPTGNLDRSNADRVGALLSEVARTEHVALVVVTHGEHLAARFERRVQLVDGKLVSTG